MMTAKQFEKTGSVINLQTRKRNTSHKRKNAKIPSKKSMSEKPSLSIRKASKIRNSVSLEKNSKYKKVKKKIPIRIMNVWNFI